MATEFLVNMRDPSIAYLGDLMFHGVHLDTHCVGRPCLIHHPSDHHMRGWTLAPRADGRFERVCRHNIGHPDPDGIAYLKLRGLPVGTHGCDGCCIPGRKTMRYLKPLNVHPPTAWDERYGAYLPNPDLPAEETVIDDDF